MKQQTSAISALAFDTGGTVFDWYSGITAALSQAGERRGLASDWDAVALRYRNRSLELIRGAVHPQFTIDDVHRSVLDEVIDEFGLGAFTSEDRDRIWRAWHELRAWPDVKDALARLRTRFVVASFTVLTTSLVVDASRVNGLVWDCILSCEMFGIYKTQPESYRTAARLLGLDPSQVMMVAAHNFDLEAARAEGFASAWIRRPDEYGPSGHPDPEPNPVHDVIANDFGELATALGV